MEGRIYPCPNILRIYPCSVNCKEERVKSTLYNRRHGCSMDDSYDYDDIEITQKSEYYKLRLPEGCPFEFEQRMSEMNSDKAEERKKFWFTPWIGGKRTCQHCGAVIPNKSECPNCGYKRYLFFNIEKDSVIFHACGLWGALSWVGRLVFVWLMSMMFSVLLIIMMTFLYVITQIS